MTWLNTNAPAVQAAAAVASLLIAAVLAGVTWNYMRLTRSLVETARQQLEFIRSDRASAIEERRQRLLSLILHIRMSATAVGANRSRGEEIRHVPLWSEKDQNDLRALAGSFGPQIAELAGEAARHLEVLRELSLTVKNTPAALGVDWDSFPWARWSKALEGAERCLQSVATLIERDAARPTTT